MIDFEIVPLTGNHREWAGKLITQNWGSSRIVTRGRVHDTSVLPGFVAIRENRPVGLATYRFDGDQCEIVSLDSLMERKGAGTALVDAVKKAAHARGCKRLWLITTNDNLGAVRFYQKRGFCLVAIHRNALECSRKIKPEIPPTGIDSIPLRDEIELELVLQPEETG